jgi:hypothetical protein
MALTTILDWTVVRADTWSRTFTIRDENNDVPAGLATSTITMTTRDVYDAVTIVADTAAGEITANGTTGEVTVVLSSTDTAAVKVGQYRYDLEVLSVAGVRLTPVIGSLTVRNDYSRS